MKFKSIKFYLRPSYHIIKVFPYILQENSFLKCLSLLCLSLFQIQKIIFLKVGGVSLKIRTASTDVSVAVSCLMQDEFLTANSVKHLKHNFIIDAGGYIGTAAIALAKMFPQSTIVCLEPSEKNFELLQYNIKSFPNIFPIKAALLSNDEKSKLYNAGTGEWGFSTVRDLSGINTDAMHEIQGISVPTLLKKFNKSGIDIMKIDIEGGEKELFLKSKEWIQLVGFVIVELHDAILPGCEQAYKEATAEMTQLTTGGEKVVAFNQSFFEV